MQELVLVWMSEMVLVWMLALVLLLPLVWELVLLMFHTIHRQGSHRIQLRYRRPPGSSNVMVHVDFVGANNQCNLHYYCRWHSLQ